MFKTTASIITLIQCVFKVDSWCECHANPGNRGVNLNSPGANTEQICCSPQIWPEFCNWQPYGCADLYQKKTYWTQEVTFGGHFEKQQGNRCGQHSMNNVLQLGKQVINDETVKKFYELYPHQKVKVKEDKKDTKKKGRFSGLLGFRKDNKKEEETSNYQSCDMMDPNQLILMLAELSNAVIGPNIRDGIRSRLWPPELELVVQRGVFVGLLLAIQPLGIGNGNHNVAIIHLNGFYWYLDSNHNPMVIGNRGRDVQAFILNMQDYGLEAVFMVIKPRQEALKFVPLPDKDEKKDEKDDNPLKEDTVPLLLPRSSFDADSYIGVSYLLSLMIMILICIMCVILSALVSFFCGFLVKQSFFQKQDGEDKKHSGEHEQSRIIVK